MYPGTKATQLTYSFLRLTKRFLNIPRDTRLRDKPNETNFKQPYHEMKRKIYKLSNYLNNTISWNVNLSMFGWPHQLYLTSRF